MTAELEIKLLRVRNLLDKERLQGVLLSSIPNYFWMSCGGNEIVDLGTGETASKILVTADHLYAVCNSSEKYRVMDEVLDKNEFKELSYLWHQKETDVLSAVIDINKLGSDTGIYGTRNISNQLTELRYELTGEEILRYKKIGPEAADILEKSMLLINPGENEFSAAGKIISAFTANGYIVPVCMVGSDERIFKYRHPVTTNKVIRDYVMSAVCVQKYGLTISISRLISFGPLCEKLKEKYEAILSIDAVYNENTIEGNHTSDILKAAHRQYIKCGYADDFDLHHQGGAIGYMTRDYCATESTDEIIHLNQAFAWNPTIAGVKAEDTILVENDGPYILSDSANWKYEEIDWNGRLVRRPVILEL